MSLRYCSESNIAYVSPVVDGDSRLGFPPVILGSVRPTLDWRQVVHALFAGLCLSFAAPIMAYLIINQNIWDENNCATFGAKAEFAGVFKITEFRSTGREPDMPRDV